MSRTGPIVFADETARAQLLSGEVVTFRKAQRTTGETHARWKRTGKKKADVLVEEIGAVDPHLEDALNEFREQSGFESVDAWRAAMAELNGDIPEKGYLYRVTLQNETLPEWSA